MTALTSVEVETYYERVRAALSDLPADARDELLEELPDHLAEVVAEEGGSLVDRLGEPEAYAAELRAAAGYEAVVPDARRNLVAEWRTKSAERWRVLDERGARWAGYDRVADLVRALRPGWWVLRGWLVAQLLSGAHNRATWHGFVPSAGGNSLLGFLLLVCAIAASLWIGTRSITWGVWPRRLTALVGVALAVWGIGVLAKNVGGTEYSYFDSGSNAGYDDPLQSVQDVYVYDQNGKPVPNARLFDQNGNPVQLGQGYCTNGEVAPNVNDQTAWTYPLCPSDPGPFQAGPGAATGISATPSASAPQLAPSHPTASKPAASKPRASATTTSGPKASKPRASAPVPTATTSR